MSPRTHARPDSDSFEAPPFLERHAGLVLSLCFHLVLFGGLVARTEPPDPPFVEPPPIRVELSPVPAATPPPEIARATVPGPRPPDAAATADAESEAPPGDHPGVAAPEASPEGESVLRPGESSESPSDGGESEASREATSLELATAAILDESRPHELELLEPDPTPPPDPEPPEPRTAESSIDPMDLAEEPPDDPAPSRDAEARRRAEMELLKEIMDEQRDDLARAADRRLTEKGSPEIEERLRLAAVDQSAKKWLRTDDGRREGIVRGLDTSGVPDSVAQGVLGRYGIRIVLKQLDGSARGMGYDYLNEAKAGGDVYYNRVGSGIYKVFSYGQGAIARMMQLETDEIARQGHDPATARVLEVEFGIVAVPGGYDLGVKRIRIEPMPVATP